MAARARENPDAAVTLAGPNRRPDERLTFDVTCRQVLMEITGSPSNYEHTLLLERVQGSVWVTLDTDLNMSVEDISEFQLVILGRKSPFPLAGRPFLILAPLDRNRLMEFQSQARAMADLHRNPLVTAGAAAGAVVAPDDVDGRWYFADTGHPQFGTPVPIESLSVVEHVRREDECGMIKVMETGQQMRWTFMELVPSGKFKQWLTEKRQGAGRDKRLSPLPEVTGMVAILPLFRECSLHHTRPSVPMVSVYEGPSAYDELSAAIVGSGMEPLAYGMSLVSQCGLSPKGMAAATIKNIIFTIYLLSVRDRLNASELAAAEHLAGWALQIIEAHRNNPKQADYDGLEGYMVHMQEAGTGVLRAGKFANHIADKHKSHSFILKQFRLSQEEITSAAKKDKQKDKKDPKGKGKGQDTKEDD